MSLMSVVCSSQLTLPAFIYVCTYVLLNPYVLVSLLTLSAMLGQQTSGEIHYYIVACMDLITAGM